MCRRLAVDIVGHLILDREHRFVPKILDDHPRDVAQNRRASGITQRVSRMLVCTIAACFLLIFVVIGIILVLVYKPIYVWEIDVSH